MEAIDDGSSKSQLQSQACGRRRFRWQGVHYLKRARGCHDALPLNNAPDIQRLVCMLSSSLASVVQNSQALHNVAQWMMVLHTGDNASPICWAWSSLRAAAFLALPSLLSEVWTNQVVPASCQYKLLFCLQTESRVSLSCNSACDEATHTTQSGSFGLKAYNSLAALCCQLKTLAVDPEHALHPLSADSSIAASMC